MAIVYDDILEAITFRRMDTASDENLERYLRNYLGDHDLHPNSIELNWAKIRYRIFGRKIFDIYRIYQTDIYTRSHKRFLIEVAHNAIVDITHIDRIVGRMLNNKNIEWDKVYAYYDMIGHEKFGDLAPYLDKHRDELIAPSYDII